MVKPNIIVSSHLNNGECIDIDKSEYVSIKLLGLHANKMNAEMKISTNIMEKLLYYLWYLGKDGYPVTYCSVDNKKRFNRGLKIHQMLLGKHGCEYAIDHINRNKLDNRLCNLRICTKQENNYNRSKSKNSQYAYKGIKLQKNGLYTAYVTKDGKKYEIKDIDGEINAATTHDAMAEELLGHFAPKNFTE